MSPEFLLTSLIVVIAPGTGVIYTLSSGLTRGAWVSVLAAFGCTLGIVPHVFAAILGLATLLHTSALAFQVFKYAGLAYLLYLAWVTLKDRSTLELDNPQSEASKSRLRDGLSVILKGLLINILNPKLSIFFMAFLPQFVAPSSPTLTMDMAGLSLVFMAMTFAVFVLYGVFAASVRHHVVRHPSVMTWLRRLFAGAFAGLGVKLAFSDAS